MKKKKIIVFIIIFIIISLFVVSNTYFKSQKVKPNYTNADYINYNNLNNSKYENNIKYNTSEKMKEEQKFKTFIFNDMKLYSEEGYSKVEFNISCKRNCNDAYRLSIDFYDEENKIIYSAITTIDKNDVKNGRKELKIPDDIINAYYYKITLGYKLN